jgi:hypothetical protein
MTIPNSFIYSPLNFETEKEAQSSQVALEAA